MKYTNIARVDIEHNKVSDEDLVRRMAHDVIEKMEIEDLLKLFNVQFTDPFSVKSMEILKNKYTFDYTRKHIKKLQFERIKEIRIGIIIK